MGKARFSQTVIKLGCVLPQSRSVVYSLTEPVDSVKGRKQLFCEAALTTACLRCYTLWIAPLYDGKRRLPMIGTTIAQLYLACALLALLTVAPCTLDPYSLCDGNLFLLLAAFVPGQLGMAFATCAQSSCAPKTRPGKERGIVREECESHAVTQLTICDTI